MPADFESGMFVRVPAWHGMGTVTGDYPGDWDEARKLAGLDWEPVSAPSFGFKGIREDGSVTYDPAEAVSGDYFTDADRQRIVRSDTGALLGVPHDVYTIISNKEMGEIIESLLDQPNVKYETAVCLSGGRKVAACVKLDEPITIPGDDSVTLPLLALTNRHDGEGACRGQATDIRVVCGNTFAMAESQADHNGTVFTFTHGRNWRDRLEEAREAIKGVKRESVEYAEFATSLTKIKFNKSKVELYLAEFMPQAPESIAQSDRVKKNIEDARQAVRNILKGETIADAHRNTGYGVFQASIEYLDHYRPYRNRESLMGRQLLRPERMKTRAAQLVQSIGN